MNLYKNVPGKKFYYSRKCMGTLDVYNHAKKGELILKHPDGYIQRTDAFSHDLNDFFLRFFSFGYIFIWTFFLWSYFLRLYWQPLCKFRKKKSQELKTQVFLETVFSGLSYIDSHFLSQANIQLFYQHNVQLYLYIKPSVCIPEACFN